MRGNSRSLEARGREAQRGTQPRPTGANDHRVERMIDDGVRARGEPTRGGAHVPIAADPCGRPAHARGCPGGTLKQRHANTEMGFTVSLVQDPKTKRCHHLPCTHIAHLSAHTLNEHTTCHEELGAAVREALRLAGSSGKTS